MQKIQGRDIQVQSCLWPICQFEGIPTCEQEENPVREQQSSRIESNKFWQTSNDSIKGYHQSTIYQWRPHCSGKSWRQNEILHVGELGQWLESIDAIHVWQREEEALWLLTQSLDPAKWLYHE